MARKRDERAVRAAQKKERQAQSYLADDPNFVNFAQQLGSIGLKLRDIPGDGNCLFRALGDQLDGNGKNHHKHREDVVDYMLKHREDFEPFIEDDIPFQRYLENLRKVGTYAGNDAIVAFARLHKLTVVIHQFNSPLWQIHGSEDKNAKQIHISYHNGDHYSSVRKTSDLTGNPTSIKLKADGTMENGSNSTSSVNSSVSSKSSKKGHYYNTTNSSTSSSLVSPVASKYNVYQTSSDTFTWLPQNQQDSEGMFLNADLECNDDSNVVVTGDEYYQTGGYDNDAGVARAIRDEDSLVEQISHETGCQDLQLIRESLQENFMDIGATVALITQVMFSMHGSEDNSLWTANGTGTRIFGNSQTGTKPKQQQTARATKQQKKLEKKSRATERHKQRLLGHTDSGYHGSKDSSEDDTVIVKNMAALNI